MYSVYTWLDKLNSEFRQKVEAWLKETWDKIFITESWRSDERQTELYAQWRIKPWSIITRTTHSNHQDWLAVDIAFKWTVLYPNDYNTRRPIADIAKKYWIDWWYDLRWEDKPHFQDNFTTLNKNKMNDYLEVFKDEQALGYNPLFKEHEWDVFLSEKEIKCLCEIVASRLERRLKDYIDNRLIKIKQSI